MGITFGPKNFNPSGATSAGGLSAGQGAALGGAASAVGGLAGIGIQAGVNAAAASKANDRAKNWATRHWLYELTALKQAGINPGYIFAGKGGGQGGSAAGKVAQAHATSNPNLGNSAETAIRAAGAKSSIENTRANTALALKSVDQVNAQIELAQANADNTRAKTALERARLPKEQRIGELFNGPGAADFIRQIELTGLIPKSILELVARGGIQLLDPETRTKVVNAIGDTITGMRRNYNQDKARKAQAAKDAKRGRQYKLRESKTHRPGRKADIPQRKPIR